MSAIEGAPENYTRLAFAHAIYDDAAYNAAYVELFGALPDLSDTTRFPPSGKPGDMGAFDNMAPADKDAINRVYANIGKVFEAYLRQLISTNFGPSPFDRMLAGDKHAMTPGALRGAKLFIGKAACNECHRGPMFSDSKFHNIATPQLGNHVPLVDDGRSAGITKLLADPFSRAGVYSDQVDTAHLANLTPDGTQGQFRTAPLRNIAKTAPYMHDGVYATLHDVIDHYNRGGEASGFSGSKDVEIQPLLLDDQEMSDLEEFLGSLGDDVANDPSLIACPFDPCP
jgi:cytochrome c peroxidase